jgi:predicted GIY-YIG superfamily endonuclease
MSSLALSPIDWSDDEYHIDESTTVDLSSDDISQKSELIKMIVRAFELTQDSEHYVYCFSYDGGSRWYVGETENLYDRFSTHIRERGITNIERIEPVSDRDEGLERERELSYEVAIEKESTEIYGGR